MKRLSNLISLAFTVAFFIYSANAHAQMDMKNKNSKEEQLRSGMHKLWEDHITWTRNVILNITDDYQEPTRQSQDF